jgi:phosphatidylinositol alpha-mannosyltransferase
MAAGKAIVATDVDAISEILIKGQLGIIVPPEDPDAIAQGIIELLGNEPRRRQLSTAAYQQVLIQHNPDTIYPQIEQIFSDIMKSE